MNVRLTDRCRRTQKTTALSIAINIHEYIIQNIWPTAIIMLMGVFWTRTMEKLVLQRKRTIAAKTSPAAYLLSSLSHGVCFLLVDFEDFEVRRLVAALLLFSVAATTEENLLGRSVEPCTSNSGDGVMRCCSCCGILTTSDWIRQRRWCNEMDHGQVIRWKKRIRTFLHGKDLQLTMPSFSDCPSVFPSTLSGRNIMLSIIWWLSLVASIPDGDSFIICCFHSSHQKIMIPQTRGSRKSGVRYYWRVVLVEDSSLMSAASRV